MEASQGFFFPGPGIKATSTIHVDESQVRESKKCLVYIGLPENPQFLGPQDPEALARKIVESKDVFFFTF
jgi:cation transport regulator ChaC